MDEVIKSNDVIPFEQLVKHLTTYIHSDKYIDFIEKAYNYAVEKHAPQSRKSGEPYVNHVINVAVILAKLQVSPNVIAAGLLHDVVEDSDVSTQELERMFNSDVSSIVEAVTKLGNLPKITEEDYQAENHRKIFR